MQNICLDKVIGDTKISDNLNLFDPLYYIVPAVTEYVCLNFPEDRCVDYSVILPSGGGKFEEIKRKIIERVVNISPKPGKWFFENSKLKKGKNYYSYSTANVIENPTVADLGEDSFYIECMDCIGIGEGEWHIPESCKNCIFSEKCVKAEE